LVALLTIRRGGDVVGQCDATCYNATGKVCKCVCAGENHGAGLDRAITNTKTMAARWVERARANGQPIDDYELGDVEQLPLFPL
jgi:hypothetical protein